MKVRIVAAILALASGAAVASSVLAQAPQAQASQEWPIVIEHAPGNASTCAPGAGDPIIRVAGGAMSLRFAAFPQPIWTVTLAPDGSFNAVVPSYADPNGARITVPAGTGPRPITTLQQSHPCGYRLVPK
jgi:hypothetical protein